MRPSRTPFFLIFISAIFSLITPAVAQMKLRDELISRQKEGALTLADFSHGSVYIADFSKKDAWSEETKLPPPLDIVQDGLLSPDGTMIALTIFHHVLGQGMWNTLGTVRRNGSGLREYTSLSVSCWSPDSRRLVVYKSVKPASGQWMLLDVASGLLEEINLPSRASLTSQCWSPDGQKLVYHVMDHEPPPWNSKKKEPPDWGTIFIYDIAQRAQYEIGRGQYPTWSPDAQWIAYWNKDWYYCMRPSGEERSRLFKYKAPEFPLIWSPDSRLVLHFRCCYFWPSLQCMCEVGRWFVRRLADRSEVRVGEGSPFGNNVWISDQRR